ncbi:MAG: M60 family metallopeptidase [Oscillospiraceae bacterium]|nr:M60 family metallopeptidase [Oscillospiraceae bacterium]
MHIRKRILSLFLAAAMLASFLPAAEAAETGSESRASGSLSATLRIDYAQSLDSLRARDVAVELFQGGVSLGRLPLTQEAPDARLGAYPAAVSLRNTDGGALNGGNWPGYLDVAVGSLPRGSYVLEFTGRGFAPFRQAVVLDQYDQHVILGTGDGSFPLGDVDGSGQVDQLDQDLLASALGSTAPEDLTRYDLNGDGVIDIYDLACVSRNARAKDGGEVLSTALLDPPVEQVILSSGAIVSGSLDNLFAEDGQAVMLSAPQGQAELQIVMENPVEMAEIQIRSPEGEGEVLSGTVHVEHEDGFDDIPFDNTLPAGIHGISAIPGTGVITIALGRRVAVKEITISVSQTAGGEYASVESIRFLRDIVPEEPVQPNSEIKNLTAVPGDGRVSLRWGELPNVSGYRVDYWLRSGGEKRSLLVDVPQAEVTGLDNLKTYLFTVTPVDKGWEGKPSTEVAAEPQPSKAPDAPDMVSVTALDGGLSVSWKAVKTATYYEVYYRAESDSAFRQWGSSLSSIGTTITDLTNGVKYSLYIVAGNSIGRSGPSRTAEGTPKATDYSRPAGIPTEGLLDSSMIADIRLADAGNYHAGSYTSAAPFDPRNMIDGNFQTHWTASSNWSRNEHVICTFTQPVDLSAAIWVPRLDGGYPAYLRAYSVRVWQEGDNLDGPGTQVIPDPATGISDDAGSAHKWPNVPNFSSVSTDRFAIMPFGALKNVVKISVAAEQRDYLTVSCSELMFMEYDESRSLPDNIAALFTSPLCTQLRAGVTQADIDALRQRLNSSERNYYLYTSALDDQLALAEELLQNGKTSGAVLRGVDSRSGAADGKAYGQGGSELQPLGAAARAGSEVIIYAEGIPQGETLTVYASQFNAEANTWLKSMGTVSNGRTVLTVPQIGSQNTPRGGSLYFTYSGSNPEGISLHVRKATAIPMLDLSDWYIFSEAERREAIAAYTDQLAAYVSAQRISNADKATNCLNVTEIATPTVLLSLPAAAVLSGLGTQASREQRTETLYQSVLAWEDVMHICKTTQGIDGTYERNGMQTRQNIRCMQMFAGAFMYAAGNHIGIGYGSCAGMVCGKPISALEENASANRLFGWGIAHEIGHNMDKLGKAEITNNIYALMVQTYDGEANTFASRLEKSGKYAAIFTKTAQGHPGDSGDVFVQLGLYWQLHLAYDSGDDPMDFYNRFFKAWKAGTYFNGASSYQDKVALTAAAIADRDLTEFFTRWGMVLSDSTRAVLASKPKEDRAVWYLSDQSRRDRLAGKAAGEGTVSLTVARSAEHPDNGFDLTITPSVTEGTVQGYEILRDGESIGFTMGTSYTDIVGSANHRTYTYSARAYDTLGNCFATAEAPQVRVAYDKTVPAGSYVMSRSNDSVTFQLTEETSVSGFKLTGGQRPLSGSFTVAITGKDGKTVTARSGSFDAGNQAVDDQNSYLSYFQKPGAPETDTRIWTYDAKTVTITGIPAGMADGDIQLITYAGDDVAFLEGGFVGLLDKPYDTGEEMIPAGTLVIAGTYRGDPVYQMIKIQGRFVDTTLTGDEAGNEVVKQTETIRDLDGKLLLFAEIPEDGAVSDISDGIFLFIPNLEKEAELQGQVSSCAPKSLLPAQLRIQSYRTDVPDAADGKRLTAETLWTDSPGGSDLPKLVLEG